MNAENETATLTKVEYERMLERLDWLNCLEAAGVDNWEGYGYALEIKNGEEE